MCVCVCVVCVCVFALSTGEFCLGAVLSWACCALNSGVFAGVFFVLPC